jgi:hypothetical protein
MTPEPGKVIKMDQYIQLYSWVRGGASIHTARIEKVQIQPAAPGQQSVSLQIRIAKTLWGAEGDPLRRFEFEQPDGETARLKFSDPVWGRVELREGALILLVTREPSGANADPLYADQIVNSDGPVLDSIRAVLDHERAGQKERFARYLHWLSSGSIVEKLFSAEALAKDEGLPVSEREGQAEPPDQIAVAFARAFTSEKDLYTRISLGTWMWDNVYPRSTVAGQVAIINATIQSAGDKDQDVRRFSLDQLTTAADPMRLRQADVMTTREVIGFLQERLGQETSPEARDRIKRVVDALRR